MGEDFHQDISPEEPTAEVANLSSVDQGKPRFMLPGLQLFTFGSRKMIARMVRLICCIKFIGVDMKTTCMLPKMTHCDGV